MGIPIEAYAVEVPRLAELLKCDDWWPAAARDACCTLTNRNHSANCGPGRLYA